MTDSEFCAECEKRAEKIGRPKELSGGWCDVVTIRDEVMACAGQYPASVKACIWERHVRERLVSRGCIIASSPTGHTITQYDDAGVRAGLDEPPKFHIESDDYYAALLAAVDAVVEVEQ